MVINRWFFEFWLLTRVLFKYLIHVLHLIVFLCNFDPHIFTNILLWSFRVDAASHTEEFLRMRRFITNFYTILLLYWSSIRFILRNLSVITLHSLYIFSQTATMSYFFIVLLEFTFCFHYSSCIMLKDLLNLIIVSRK